jgi:DNA-binding HxlR family transcriptional regulator
VRSGAFALSLLATPLNVDVLGALQEEPRNLSELRRAAGTPPPTTMRKHLRVLTEVGAVRRHQQPGFPGTASFELGPSGADLLELSQLLEDWLGASPEGPLPLGGSAAKGALKALIEGWNSRIVRAIAARPLCLTDLNQLISTHNYPSLERRLSALRFTGLVEACSNGGRSTPYGPSSWLRRAGGVLMAAAHWERRSAAAATAGERFDFETAFLLGLPDVSLSSEADGRCRLGVELRNSSGERTWAGVQVQVASGEIGSCVPHPEGEVEACASGNSGAWVGALTEGDPGQLDFSGDRQLAVELVDGLHRGFFRVRQVI